MSNDKITVYAHLFPSRAERVIWTLNELGLDYEVIRLDVKKGDLMSEEFGKLNPARKIPVLVHGEKILTESLAICEYLCHLAPEKRLLPETLNEHYEFRWLMNYATSEVEAYLWVADQAERLVQIYPWPEGSKDFAVELVRRNIRGLDKHVAVREFACGDRFTLVDIYIAQLIGWAHQYGLKASEGALNYVKGIMGRPHLPESMRKKA